jgi:hypothetical protein
LRGNETQEKILYELEMLKSSIKQTVQAAFRHDDSFSHLMGDPSDARVAYNLQNLARAAQNFHSSASSTASTIHGANGTSFWNLQSDAAMSIMGGPSLTPNKRQQIEGYIKQQRRMTQRRKRKSPLQRVSSSAAASVVIPPIPEPDPTPAAASEDADSIMSEMADENDEQDEEAEFQSFLLSGLEEVAKDSMLNQDFAKAQSMLEEAIQRRTGSTSEEADFKQLQIQLAICYFCQHKWNLAEPLIDSIAKSKANFDPVVCNLLHALAIANLVEKRFEKAITVCKQALQGKRRLKRDFGDTSETECNQTLGLLATIHDLHGSRLDAEALRRKLSKGFSYHHPENELEFLVNHPKLCTDVFGKKIILDWRRPQMPATDDGNVAELIADLPSKNFLAPTKEEDTPKTNKTGKKPLQTFHTKLNLYERVNMDSAKEVIGSSSPSSNNSVEYLYSDTNFLSELPGTIPKTIPKRSLTRKVVRFLGTLKERPGKPRDNWSTYPTPINEDVNSPSQPKMSKGFWSKSDGNLFKLMEPKTKPRKRSSDKGVKSSFSILRQHSSWELAQQSPWQRPAYNEDDSPDPRPWRLGVDQWLGSNTSSNYSYNSRWHSPDDYLSSSSWVPASQIHEEEEEQNLPVVYELEGNSFSPPVRNSAFYPGAQPMASERQLMTAHTTGHDLYEYKVQGPAESTSTLQELAVIIPEPTGRPKAIPLVAHYPVQGAQASLGEITEDAEPQPTSSIASSSSFLSTLSKPEIIAKILDDFNDDDTGILAVKEKLERDFDEFMRKESQGKSRSEELALEAILTFVGLRVGESGRRQAWVPASYFNFSPVVPAGSGTIDRAPEDSQQRESEMKDETLMDNEIDDFSRAFHGAIGQSEDNKALTEIMSSTRQSSPSGSSSVNKPRHQFVDEAFEETAKSPTQLEQLSTPKLATNRTRSEEEAATAAPADLETKIATPPQLSRKFSWETETQQETLPTAPIETVPEVVGLAPIRVLNRESSWSSDDTNHTPSLIRSSTTSSSSTSASSYTSASSSVSNGSLLKFDPISKGLIIVGSDPTSPLSEFQGHSLDDFLESLSANIPDRRSKKLALRSKTRSFVSTVDVKVEHSEESNKIDSKAGGAVGVDLRACQANEKATGPPTLRPTDVFIQMVEEEALSSKKDSLSSNDEESILSHSYPFRSRKKRQKQKQKKNKSKGDKKSIVTFDEKRELFPPGIASWGPQGNLRIDIAV